MIKTISPRNSTYAQNRPYPWESRAFRSDRLPRLIRPPLQPDVYLPRKLSSKKPGFRASYTLHASTPQRARAGRGKNFCVLYSRGFLCAITRETACAECQANWIHVSGKRSLFWLRGE